MASWPQSSDRRSRRRLSPGVRRRVDVTLRRGMRQAVLVGAPLLVVILGANAVQALMRGGPDARAGAVISVVEMTIVLVGALLTRRGVRSEPIAMALLLTIYTVTVFEPGVVEISSDLSLAYLAMVLLASSLFLPWHPRWHVTWLGIALAITVSGAGAGTLGGADAGLSALVVTGMAAAAGGLGHALAHSRMRRGIEQRFELRELSAVSVRQEASVTQLNEELAVTARLDSLTGLGNRRALDDALDRPYRSAGWPRSCWTSITSRTSTTGTGTSPAMLRWRAWASCCGKPCARTIWHSATAARSSSFSSPVARSRAPATWPSASGPSSATTDPPAPRG